MAEPGEPLTDRELGVLELLVNGSTNREIARDLAISPNTVKVHLRNIFTKLGASSRTEATTLAIQKGLVLVPGLEPDTVESPLPVTGEPAPPAPATGLEPVAEPAPSRAMALPWRWPLSLLILLVLLTVGVVVVSLVLDRNPGSNGELTSPEPLVEEPLGDTNWKTSQPLPRPRADMAIASVGLDLYLIGGQVEAGVINLVDVYETSTGRWRSGEGKPTAVSDVSAAVLFGEIYLPGGLLADDRPTAVVEAFSPANNAWRPVAPLPQPLAGALTLADGNALYLFGGWDGSAFRAESYVYDLANDQWLNLPPMSHSRADAAGGLIEGRFYVVGGRDETGELAVCEVYDPVAETWSGCPPLTLPRAKAGAAVLANHLLYILGGGLEGEVPYGEFFDSKTEQWQPVEMPMLTEDSAWPGLGVTNVETRIYALGGRQDSELSAANYIYLPFIHRTFLPTVGGE